jgi:hypothetical protein
MRSLYVCLLLAMPHVFCFAEPADFAQQRNQAYDLWLIRSQTITEDLLKDAADLNLSHRALLWARLAQRWWRDNPEKAKSWMAVSLIEMDEYAVKEAVSSISSPETRAHVRLELLGACLQRMRGSKQPGPKVRPTT